MIRTTLTLGISNFDLCWFDVVNIRVGSDGILCGDYWWSKALILHSHSLGYPVGIFLGVCEVNTGDNINIIVTQQCIVSIS